MMADNALIPEPLAGEGHSQFVSRCVSALGKDGDWQEAGRESMSAACLLEWRKRKGKSLDTIIEPDVRQERPCPQPQLVSAPLGGKEGDDDNGWIEGYASVFDNIDLQGEIVRRGAFKKSIKERIKAGKVKLMVRHMAHGGDTTEIVGTITKAKEDGKGLWVHAEFAGTTMAQETRKLVAEGHVGGLSVGYLPVNWKQVVIEQETYVELLELKIMEVTITAIPANELALVTAAKALTTAAEALEGKALSHNSKVADSEPSWGSVDKTKLPRGAFAEKGEAGSVSTWGYPHHWVSGGGEPDDAGRYTTGTMYLHKGGLNAAWAAAQGARSGQEASSTVKSHLNTHRKALGLVEGSSLGAPDGGRTLCSDNREHIESLLERLEGLRGKLNALLKPEGPTGMATATAPHPAVSEARRAWLDVQKAKAGTTRL